MSFGRYNPKLRRNTSSNQSCCYILSPIRRIHQIPNGECSTKIRYTMVIQSHTWYIYRTQVVKGLWNLWRRLTSRKFLGKAIIRVIQKQSWGIWCKTSIRFHGRSGVKLTSLFGAQESRWEGLEWATTFIPGGAIEILSKSNIPNKYAYAESFGLLFVFRRRFMVISACLASASIVIRENQGWQYLTLPWNGI